MKYPFKKNLLASILAGFLIGVLFIPVAYNFGIAFNYIIVISIVVWVLVVAGALIGIALSKILPVLFQIVKFGIVGVLNTLVDFGVLNLLFVIFSITSGIGYSIFKGTSFIIAVANSYVWNKYWTFESKDKANSKEMATFLTVSIVGFFINVISATIVVNYIPVMFGLSNVVWANIGALVGTVIGMTWNFLGYKMIVFKK